MRIKTDLLTAELIERTRNLINRVQQFKGFSDEELNRKKSKDQWSILECIEHLNLYGDFYNPEISKRIESSNSKSNPTFKSSRLGNYFTTSMLPSEKMKKMKTFKDKNPVGSNLKIDVLDRFINQQNNFHSLIEKSRNVDLKKTKTTISISKIMKLRLGDTFRFIIAHNERHILQAEKVLK